MRLRTPHYDADWFWNIAASFAAWCRVLLIMAVSGPIVWFAEPAALSAIFGVVFALACVLAVVVLVRTAVMAVRYLPDSARPFRTAAAFAAGARLVVQPR